MFKGGWDNAHIGRDTPTRPICITTAQIGSKVFAYPCCHIADKKRITHSDTINVPANSTSFSVQAERVTQYTQLVLIKLHNTAHYVGRRKIGLRFRNYEYSLICHVNQIYDSQSIV